MEAKNDRVAKKYYIYLINISVEVGEDRRWYSIVPMG